MSAIGFVGFGNLGLLLGKGFSKDFKISYYDPEVDLSAYKKCDNLDDLVKISDIILIATPSGSFKNVLAEITKQDLANKLIVDVLSTKSLAADCYNTYLPNANVLSLHPLFGPPSYSEFKPGLRIVSCFSSGKKADEFVDVLINKYQFKVIEKSADEHDRHMAVHHAIPFILAHALAKTDFKNDPGDLTIPSEEKLRKIVDIAGNESLDLYLTIMRSNPYAKKAVEDLLKTLAQEQKSLWP